MTHADTVLQLPFRGNCMNWVLGHLVDNRNQVLAALGEPLALDETLAARYERDSEPVVQADDAVALEQLMAALDDSQDRILAALEKVTAVTLSTIHNEERQTTLGDWIEFLHWHETYHVGQLEILRQLAGTDDKII